MKVLFLAILAAEAITGKGTNGCHLKTAGHIDLVFQDKLGACMNTSARYKVSMIKPLARITVDR